MWKILFELSDRFFAIIPIKKWRRFLREIVLFDYRNKLNALRRVRPDLNFKKMQLAKGGGSLVFIIDNDTFKVRKKVYESGDFKRFHIEKRITDAIRPFCTIEIPKINFVKSGKYVFYETRRIPGTLLVNIPSRKIKKYQKQISAQLAEFIYKKSFGNPDEIADLRKKPVRKGYSWVHGDMCSNILVNPKNMKITGIIDWEWAGYGKTEDEFFGIVRVRKKMRKIGIDKSTQIAFDKIAEKSKK